MARQKNILCLEDATPRVLRSYLHRSVGALALAGSLVALARDARADNPPSVSAILGVQICEPDLVDCRVTNPPGIPVGMVDYEDCAGDFAYQFDLGLSYPNAADQLQAWVGQVDCTQAANRASGACWEVAAPSSPPVSPTLLAIRARDIAAGAFPSSQPTPRDGSSYEASTDPALCQSQPRTVLTDFTLSLFWTDSDGNTVGASQQFPLMVDLRAGVVAGPVTLGEADGGVVVNVPETTDPDTQGYNVYCDPAPQGTVEAAAAAAGTCGSSSVLTANAPAPAWKYICGQGLGSSTSIAIAGLRPGEAVNIAVAATDGTKNVGPLSNVVCAASLAPMAPIVQTPAGGSSGATVGAIANSEGEGGTEAAGVSCAASGIGGAVRAGAGSFWFLLAAAIVGGARRARASRARSVTQRVA